MARNRISGPIGRAKHIFERTRLEPALDFGPQAIEIHTTRAIVARQVDHVPDPVEIDRCVLAVVLKQRNGDARNRRGFHVRERALEHRQAAHANDGVDLAGLDHRHHDRRTLGHQHRVPQPLRFVLQVLNRAEAALLAEQPELVERRGTLVLDPEALGKEQQPAIVGNGGEVVAPHFVAQQHTEVVPVRRIDVGVCRHAIGMPAQLVDHERRHEAGAMGFDVARDRHAQAFPLGEHLRNVRLRRAHAVGHDAQNLQAGKSH